MSIQSNNHIILINVKNKQLLKHLTKKNLIFQISKVQILLMRIILNIKDIIDVNCYQNPLRRIKF